MAISKLNPKTILLTERSRCQIVDEYNANAAITPGHLVELIDASSELRWRKNASATEIPTMAVALERAIDNKGIDDDYAAGSQVEVAFLHPGAVFYGLIASGQDIQRAELLQSAGDGTLKTATATTADAALAKFQSLDAPGSVTVLTRIRVQAIQ